MVVFDYPNYTDARAQSLIEGTNEIQAAGVMHGDVYPRNMMVFEDEVDPERKRAMYVDFDSAQTYNLDRIPDRQKEWMQIENGVVGNIMERICLLYTSDAADE